MWNAHRAVASRTRSTGWRGDSEPEPLLGARPVTSDYGWPVASPVLLCTDGSAAASSALAAGLELLGPDQDFVLVTVMNAPDEAALVGSGHAGAELTPQDYDELVTQATDSASLLIEKVQRELSPVKCARRILRGEPGEAICQAALELSARAIVIGSRGRGGLKRVLLGSVSDYVVRNAPCSVVVTKV